MKTIAFIFLTLCTAAIVRAQKAPYYYFDKDGVALKTVFDADGKVIGNQEYTVISGDNNRVLGQNFIIRPGKKDETTTCHYCCMDGRLVIAMGLNKEGEEVFLDYYTGMSPESPIIEGIKFGTQAKLAGIRWNVTCTITDRKVTAAAESISSDLGDWNCVKTEYDMELRSNFLGIPVNVHVIEWFKPGFGVVRTDVYRKGKLYEKRLLTGFRPVSKTDILAAGK